MANLNRIKVVLSENLIRYYMSNYQGVDLEEAKETVDRLERGIMDFNDNLKAVLETGDFDFIAQLDLLSSELSVEEKYEMFVNFLAALQTLNTTNLNADTMSEIEDFETIKQRYHVSGVINEEDIENVKELLAETFENNSFVLGSVSDINRFVNIAGEGNELILNAICDVENDMKDKMVASMITYVAYKKGELSSVEYENLTPEEVAIMTAASIESSRVSSNLENGNITIETAIRLLKIIGSVAMYTLLAMALYIGISGMATSFISVLGFNAVSVAACAAFAAYVAFRFTGDVVMYSEPIMAKVTDYFGLAIATWKRRVWPKVKETMDKVSSWLRLQMESDTIQTQKTGNPDEVVYQ